MPDSCRKYFFFNLGCPKNLVDAEHVAARLEAAGWIEASAPSDAGLLVVTTCAFIAVAEEESVNEILAVASRMKEGQILAVLGCLVSREGEALKELMPEVDIFLDVESMDSLPELLEERLDSIVPHPAPPYCIPSRKLFTPPHIAYLKIADGCSNHCSYCTIPSIRGELVNTPKGSIIDEVSMLKDMGIKEIVVIAQDTGAWRGEHRDENLYDLLEAIAPTAGESWIRLMYLHPSHTDTGRLLDLIDSGIICPYLDIPIQHVSDRILSGMGRGYGREDLERIFSVLRSGSSRIFLRTTVMVGFPGEREADYRELVEFLEDYEFDHVGVFEYSREDGTPAAKLEQDVSRTVAGRRKEELLDVQMDISYGRLSENVGSTLSVLVDGILNTDERPGGGIWGVGRFVGQAYEIDGVTYLSGKREGIGCFTRASVDRAEAYDLFATSK